MSAALHEKGAEREASWFGLRDWLRLVLAPGVGAESGRKLLAALGSPAGVFAASPAALRAVMSERQALSLLQAPTEALHRQIALTEEWLAVAGNQVLTMADPAYPAALLQIPDPPLLLYVKGRAALLHTPSLAVVGSRNATAQGLQNAEVFSQALSAAGWSIVSGLAAGIDAAAHQGGLRGPGSTVAVIGTGADIVYPARNRQLAHLIAEGGCIVSEYPLGMPAIAANFPRRNRIISGLSRGVLVVEAAAQSGSLITARTALEQGREVFAIPGSIHSPLAKGCHQLIKQGAKLVESAKDIVEELQGVMPPRQPAGNMRRVDGPAHQAAVAANSAGNSLLDLLGYEAVHIDALAARTGMDVAALQAALLSLELDGAIEQLPGAQYRRLI